MENKQPSMPEIVKVIFIPRANLSLLLRSWHDLGQFVITPVHNNGFVL